MDIREFRSRNMMSGALRHPRLLLPMLRKEYYLITRTLYMARYTFLQGGVSGGITSVP